MILSPPSPLQTLPGMNRKLVIVGSVILFHFAALWALQTGLLHRVAQILVPVELLSDVITPPAPRVDVPVPPSPAVQPRPVAKRPAPQPAPQPLAIADPTPAPNAPTGVLTPQPPAPPMGAPVAVTPAAPSAPPAPARVELPSTDADYLNNPKPAYPPLSKRMGEQGKVVVRVLIGADGLPPEGRNTQAPAAIERLDQAALATVMKWRYVPGKRAGVAGGHVVQRPDQFCAGVNKSWIPNSASSTSGCRGTGSPAVSPCCCWACRSRRGSSSCSRRSTSSSTRNCPPAPSRSGTAPTSPKAWPSSDRNLTTPFASSPWKDARPPPTSATGRAPPARNCTMHWT